MTRVATKPLKMTNGEVARSENLLTGMERTDAISWPTPDSVRPNR